MRNPEAKPSIETIKDPEDIRFLQELAEASSQLGEAANAAKGQFEGASAINLHYGTMRELRGMFDPEKLRILKDVLKSVGSEVYPK